MPGGDAPCGARCPARAIVLANSAGIAALARRRAPATSAVVHLGTDLPAEPQRRERGRRSSRSATSIARKRHADVIRALWLLRERRPSCATSSSATAPSARALEQLAADLGVRPRRVPRPARPRAGARAARRCALIAMPSDDEAFGVAYVEAMAGGVPAIGCARRARPRGDRALGDGMLLVPPGDPSALAAQIERALDEPRYLHELGAARRDRRRALHLGALRRATPSPPTRRAAPAPD